LPACHLSIIALTGSDFVLMLANKSERNTVEWTKKCYWRKTNIS